MISGKTVLGVIPARGGSKTLPRKNVRMLAGKPLIAWTIEAAQRSACLDRLVLSSDDEEIADVARAYGCEVPFRRPAHLAQDDTPSIDVLLHAMQKLPAHDYLVMLQPTSPLRCAEDIDECLRRCVEEDVPACVSVTGIDKPPQWMYWLDAAGRMHPVLEEEAVTRRQDAPATYVLNGAVYVARWDWLREKKTFLRAETRAYVMPKERSLDIDTALDLEVAALLLEPGHPC